MSAIKDAFDKIGEGIKHFAEGVGHAFEGAVKVVGGALTCNPALLKDGANEFDKGMHEGIKGAGEALGGVAGAAIGVTPLGGCINLLTHGAASRLACGVFESASDSVNGGIDGVKHMAHGLAHGNAREFFKGALAVADLASMAVPGAGEAKMLATTGKNLLMGGVQTVATNEVGKVLNPNQRRS
jgi:hypothetical protein